MRRLERRAERIKGSTPFAGSLETAIHQAAWRWSRPCNRDHRSRLYDQEQPTMAQTVEFDLKQSVLRNDTFGPREVRQMQDAIAQMQRFSSYTSHRPFRVPPQAPFRWFLAHRDMGHR